MAAGSSWAVILLAVLVLAIFADPCESQELRCQCIQIHSDFISPKFITNVQLIPEGAYCSRKEIIGYTNRTRGFPFLHIVTTFVISHHLDDNHSNRSEGVTLKDGKLICLDPEAEWVMTIIKKIMGSAPN